MTRGTLKFFGTVQRTFLYSFKCVSLQFSKQRAFAVDETGSWDPRAWDINAFPIFVAVCTLITALKGRHWVTANFWRKIPYSCFNPNIYVRLSVNGINKVLAHILPAHVDFVKWRSNSCHSFVLHYQATVTWVVSSAVEMQHKNRMIVSLWKKFECIYLSFWCVFTSSCQWFPARVIEASLLKDLYTLFVCLFLYFDRNRNARVTLKLLTPPFPNENKRFFHQLEIQSF